MKKTTSTTSLLLGMLFLSISLILPAQSHANDQIYWYTSDWAPFYIIRGKMKHKGINDRLIRYIHQYLPQYEMEMTNMNAALLEKSFMAGDNVCQLDMFKTPHREKMAYFSKFPSLIDAPLRLFIRGEDEKKLNLPAQVDIDWLLNNAQLKGTFVTSRSYNTLIDTALKNAQNANLDYNESTRRIIKDFFKGKTDYIVEYSAVMSYLKTLFRHKGKIYSIPIKNTEPYVLGYVGCSKTLWGKTTVDAIDKVLKEHRHDQAYKAILEQWHDDRSRQVLIDNYQNF